MGKGKRTLQVGALLLAKAGAGLLNAASEADLYIPSHDLLSPRHRAGVLAVADHLLDALDATVALVEALRDALCQALDLALLGALGLLVVEARQDVFLVQALEGLGLSGDVGQEVRHLVADVGPPRRQQVHLDDGVPIVVVVAPRQQPLGILPRARASDAATVAEV